MIIPPPIALILGKRGGGKSAMDYRLLELFRYYLTPSMVGAPSKASKSLPEWLGIWPNLEDLPENSIAQVEEA